MTFFKNFNAQNNFKVILYLIGKFFFEFSQRLRLWWLFK